MNSKRVTVDFLINKADSDMIVNDHIKLAPFAKIMNSSLSGNMFLGLSSCINRSEIGRYVGVAYFSYLADTLSGNYCTFGSRVSVGAFSHPTDSLTVHEVGYRNTTESYGETMLAQDSKHYLEARAIKTKIGNDVWVGDNSVIIKGIEIGNGAIVAAGSIVTKDVAPFSIVAGNPARTIRMRFPDDIINKIQAVRWWDLSMKELQGVSFQNIDLSLKTLEELRSRRGGR
ncbi:MAG: CatB-related O-acetyltransferase [Nitrospiraceae bacterium]